MVKEKIPFNKVEIKNTLFCFSSDTRVFQACDELLSGEFQGVVKRDASSLLLLTALSK